MIHVLIADDHPVVRAGVRRILAEAPDLEVVAEAGSGPEVIEQVKRQKPDVVVLDITMPGAPFLELLQHLKRHHPGTRVLVLSVHPEEQYARRAVRAGAAGYLTKDRSPEQLVGAIRKVARGGKYVSEAFAELLATELESGGTSVPHEALSDREHEVLCLFGAGKTVKEIAAELSLSPKTVSTFRARILRKMRLKTSAELIRYAVEHELTP